MPKTNTFNSDSESYLLQSFAEAPMGCEMHKYDRPYALVSPALRHLASRIIENISPGLYGRLRVRRLRSSLCEYEMLIAPLLCDKSKVSIDIGASDGSYAVNICNYSSKCVAFEPREVPARRLREMAAATGLKIEVENVALSDSAGWALLRGLAEDPGRSSIESANELDDLDGSPRTTIRISKMRLDDYELPEVGFIKIDVEGHELAVLKGAQRTLRTSMPNILVEIKERHCKGATGEVSAFMASLGYEGFFILHGDVIPIARFDQSVHQNPTNIGSWQRGWERHGIYVNNFFFVPSCNCSLLSRLVSMIDSNVHSTKDGYRGTEFQ